MRVTATEEQTCIADSRVKVFLLDMFGIEQMFCYELGVYVSVKRCKSRNPDSKCKLFKSIKDFKDEQGDRKQ